MKSGTIRALFGLVGGCSLAVCLASCADALPLTFTVFTDPHSVVSGGTIGFAYAGNKFVGSVQGDGPNRLYSTDLNGGSVAVFAPTVSLAASPSGEHFVASSLGLGGFPSRDVYVAEGTGIRHITNDGTGHDVFVSGLASNVRGILFDAIGTFGHDMLVTTDGGHVYRITSSGVVTLLANIGLDTEGLDIAPLGANFGSFDGQLIVASETTGQLRAITPGGTVTVLPVFIPNGPEELTFVPLNLGASGSPVEGFYGSNYTPNVIKADAGQFAGLQGDLIVTSEFGDHRVTRVHWNGSAFETSVIGNFPNQPEDGIFVTASIINPKPTVDLCRTVDDFSAPQCGIPHDWVPTRPNSNYKLAAAICNPSSATCSGVIAPPDAAGNFVGVLNPADANTSAKLAHTAIAGPWASGTCFEVTMTATRDHCAPVPSPVRPTKGAVVVGFRGWAAGPVPVVTPATDNWSRHELFTCTQPIFLPGDADPGDVTRTIQCCPNTGGQEIAFVTWTIAGQNQRHNTFVTFDCVPR